MKNFESAPKKAENEARPDESGFKPYNPEDREEIMYQFKYGSPAITVYKKASGIYVDRKMMDGLYRTLLKNQQSEIKNLCREIDATCQSHPKMNPQEVANNKSQ